SETNVYANLTLARLAGRYGTLTHDVPRYTGDINNEFHFMFRQLGLDTTGTFTISLIGLSANIIATGSPAVFSNLSILQTVSDSVSFTLDPGVAPGDEIKYIVSLDNGWYTIN